MSVTVANSDNQLVDKIRSVPSFTPLDRLVHRPQPRIESTVTTYDPFTDYLHTSDPLVSPALAAEEIPVKDETIQFVLKTRQETCEIVQGVDDRLNIIVGPCSIHDPVAALDYAKQLKVYRDEFKGELNIIMRVYFEKPRTTVGWKGLINDPDLNNSYNINKGLRMARSLLNDICELGVPTGAEFLETITPQFFSELITWGAIGARTTESQVHRQLASGVSVPVGFKNGTNGSAQVAVDAIRAAFHPHSFLGVTKQGLAAIVTTKGNKNCHMILRGGKEPNYEKEHVDQVAGVMSKAGVDESIMIDCSHGNSRKNHNNQPLVASDVAKQIAAGDTRIRGLMIESNIKEGRQDLKDPADLEYGKSITDACVSIEQTVPMLRELAEAVKARRALKK